MIISITLIVSGIVLFSVFQVLYNLYKVVCEGEKTTKDHNKYILNLVVYFIVALVAIVALNIYVSYFQG